MKIISKFKDYYDRALALGQDDRVRYIRLTEQIPLDDLKIPMKGPFLTPLRELTVKNSEKISKLSFEPFRIWLCGKTYRGLKAVGTLKNSVWKPGVGYTYSEPEYLWTYEQFYKFVEQYPFLVQDKYRESTFGRNLGYATEREYFSAQGTDEALEYLIGHRKILLRDVHEHGFKSGRYLDEWYWEHNFPLSEIQFFKLMDPYQVYQELDMYIGGVLGQQAAEVINISDKDRIHQHGFDGYSFRKQPEEGGKKKRKPG